MCTAPELAETQASGISWTELQLLAGRTTPTGPTDTHDTHGHPRHHPLPLLCEFNYGLRMADPALEAALEIKLKGNALFKENKFEEAIKLYSQAIEACPKHRYG